MTGRQRFRCTGCGLRVTGRLVNGQVLPYDRAGDNDAPERSFTCAACAEAPSAADYFRPPKEDLRGS